MTQTTENAILTIKNNVFHSKEDSVSGTPIFVRTRVPIKNLFDYLAGGHSLDAISGRLPESKPLNRQSGRLIWLGKYWRPQNAVRSSASEHRNGTIVRDMNLFFKLRRLAQKSIRQSSLEAFLSSCSSYRSKLS